MKKCLVSALGICYAACGVSIDQSPVLDPEVPVAPQVARPFEAGLGVRRRTNR